MTVLTPKTEELCEQSRWDFGDLAAIFVNCTLKRSPEQSHTQGLVDISMEIMRRQGVSVEEVRAIDHDIATGVWPDMTEHGWDRDDWPAIFERVMACDILVLCTPIWLGEKSSVCTRVIERLYGNSSQLNEAGQYAYYGRVGGCLVTGNEDGVKHCAMNVLYSLQHLGYVIPPQADAGWIGEAGPWPLLPRPGLRWSGERLHQPQHHLHDVEPPPRRRGCSRTPAACPPTATSAPSGTPAVASTSPTPSTGDGTDGRVVAIAELNGTSIWYEQEGTGPPCLVLHGGLGVDHTLYQRTLAPLGERLRLVYLDHRGNGRSGRPSVDTITMEQLADDAAALAGHLGLERVVVLGHSYGGFVAQELTLRHPELVSALLLVDTTPGQLGATESPDDDQGPPPAPELVEAMSVIPSSDDELAEGMRDLFRLYLHRRDPSEIEPVLAATIFDVAAMVRGFEVLAGWSAADRLPSITAPTLVLAGRHDPVTSWPQSVRIASRIPGADLVVFEDSGHLPWLDEPDRFYDVVGEWLDRAARPVRRAWEGGS